MTSAAALGWGSPGVCGQASARDYQRRHIVPVVVGVRTVYVRREVAPVFAGFLAELDTFYPVDEGPLDDWGYACRCQRGTGPGTGRQCVVSKHASGLAVDVNAPRNPFSAAGNLVTDMPVARVRELAHRWGLDWGGDWGRPKDPMHFECNRTPDQVAAFLTALHRLAHPTPSPGGRVATQADVDQNGALGRMEKAMYDVHKVLVAHGVTFDLSAQPQAHSTEVLDVNHAAIARLDTELDNLRRAVAAHYGG